MILCISAFSCSNLSIFIPNFVHLIFLPFFLDESGQWFFPILFLFSENQLLVLLIFTIVSFISFRSDIMISSLLLTLVFCVILFPAVT